MRWRILWRITARCFGVIAVVLVFIASYLYLDSARQDGSGDLAGSPLPVTERTARHLSNDSSIRFERIRDVEGPHAVGIHRTAMAIDVFGNTYVSLDGSDLAIGTPTHVYSEREPVWVAATPDSRLYYAMPREGRLVVADSNDSGRTFQSDRLVANGFRNVSPAVQGNLVSFSATAGGPTTLYNVFLNQARNEIRFARCIEPCLRFETRTIFTSRAGKSFDHPFPFIALDQSGGIHSVFSDGQNVFVASSADNGETWKEIVQVNDPADEGGAPSISPVAVAGDSGMLAVAWLQGNRILTAFTADAFSVMPTFSSVQTAVSMDSAIAPAIAVDPMGMVWVAFRDGNKLRILREIDGPELFANALWSAVGELSTEDATRWLSVRLRSELTGRLTYFDQRAGMLLLADRVKMESKSESRISISGSGVLQNGIPVSFSLLESACAKGCREISISMNNGYFATGFLAQSRNIARRLHIVTAGGNVLNAP
jgi:hypothetical protein